VHHQRGAAGDRDQHDDRSLPWSRTASADSAATAAITAAGWVPATIAPSVLPSAAGTDRWQAATAATRPTVTATIKRFNWL
jgi:hypothetical protein